MREDNAWHCDPIFRSTLPSDDLSDYLTLLGSFVRQHGRPAYVTYCVDPLDIRLALVIGLNKATPVDLHAKVFQTNALGTWFHPNSHQNLVAADRLFLSVCRNMHSYGAVGLLFQTLCPGVLENLAPMLRDCPLHDFDAVRIDTRKQPGGEF